MHNDVIDLSSYRKNQAETQRLISSRSRTRLRAGIAFALAFCLTLRTMGCTWVDCAAWLLFVVCAGLATAALWLIAISDKTDD